MGQWTRSITRHQTYPHNRVDKGKTSVKTFRKSELCIPRYGRCLNILITRGGVSCAGKQKLKIQIFKPTRGYVFHFRRPCDGIHWDERTATLTNGPGFRRSMCLPWENDSNRQVRPTLGHFLSILGLILAKIDNFLTHAAETFFVYTGIGFAPWFWRVEKWHLAGLFLITKRNIVPVDII